LQIAGILAADDFQPSDTLATLIREVEEQIAHCDQIGREMRERSVNPAILDPGARGAAEDSEFRAARLRNGLARLEELHREAEMRQRLSDWHQNADLVEERAVKLADEMLELYPKLTSWLTNFLRRKAVVDAEVRAVNESAPGYEGRRLREIELVARGIENWGASQPIEKQLRLPAFVEGFGTAPLLWPPVEQLGVQLVAGIFPQNGTVNNSRVTSSLLFF